ncbi:MAG: glycosyltransferase family 4 protein [Actinobacteria bacterium]|nr:glycosyltransferase family 4 protein [Actinomycetota bacterium]MDA2961602.1 glycosyltransferase family 4 protein [Actinomycetota bacterium]MDA2994871.1 glycosyltransferase family 4 protein [Actinomycetota bacterium]
MTVKHLLVTNDFPPKVGGIQSVLWEWWRRLPSDSFTVLTSPHPDAQRFDAQQPFEVIRTREPVLLPRPAMVKRVNKLVARTGAELVVLDPAVPLGLIGPHLDVPYDVVLHGAEVTIPGRLPLTRQLLNRTLRHARQVISCGEYALAEAERSIRQPLPGVVLYPGVDVQRFTPISTEARDSFRERLGISPEAQLVIGVSRLVPRKGFDTLIEASVRLTNEFPDVQVLVAGSGRDSKRLQAIIDRLGAPARLLGRVPDGDLPLLYGAADVGAMLCRDRWFGLEQEGFGIVFLEAASCGTPQLAGRSGGSDEAVIDGVTGVVVDRPTDVRDVADALAGLLRSQPLRKQMSIESRERVLKEFTYDDLSLRLSQVLTHPVTP